MFQSLLTGSKYSNEIRLQPYDTTASVRHIVFKPNEYKSLLEEIRALKPRIDYLKAFECLVFVKKEGKLQNLTQWTQ